ncbi:MAG: three-Cys-motif partner protein TcmP [Acidobacteriota bacterium]|nr:three-Cys-motif partner protein TcmP [Acidobacteriota bacterium]
MPKAGFHDKPFDEATLTKLQLFELYAREWLPVFLSTAVRPEVHLFDFFAGPGTDSSGVSGSPLRLLKQVRDYSNLAQKSGVSVHVHLFDADPAKIAALDRNIDARGLRLPTVHLEVKALPFEQALQRSWPTISNSRAAKLLLMDQFGIDHVTPEVFVQLASAPTCDFLFFVSSATYYRFQNHPAIKQKISRPDDHYQTHVAVLDFYRGLLPATQRFYLSPFSLKKGSNIYGVVFGSAHPRGMDKFLQVAWAQDEINGEADFDINRENIRADQMLLPIPGFRPSKVSAFEADLEQRLRDGLLTNEAEVVQVCFDHGVRRQHAEPVLKRLKAEGVIDLGFRVPDIKKLDSPRPIRRTR